MNNLDVVRRMYRATAQRDFGTFKSLCAPGLDWIQNDGFPKGGRHSGPDAVVEKVYKGFKADWDGWRFNVGETLDAGNSVVVIGTYTARHRRTGKAFKAAAAHVLDLQDGKITRFRQYTDTKVITDALTP